MGDGIAKSGGTMMGDGVLMGGGTMMDGGTMMGGGKRRLCMIAQKTSPKVAQGRGWERIAAARSVVLRRVGLGLFILEALNWDFGGAVMHIGTCRVR